MKAYELYAGDLAGNEFTRSGADRRAYYLALRQALKEEVAGRDCPLLAHYARALGQADAPCLYLLDAAALWECHEMTVGGSRFPRDAGQGFPFPVEGRRLSWLEVQRLSDGERLPVAVADAELLGRLEGLMVRTGSRAGEAPKVNGRATLRTAPPPASVLAKAAPVPAKSFPAPVQPSPDPAEALPDRRAEEIAALREQLHAAEGKLRDLEAENARLRQMIAEPPRSAPDGDAALHTAELILHSRMTEAAVEARKLGGKLEQEIGKLTQLQTTVADLQQQLADTQTRQQTDAAQAEALRAQQQTARQAAEAARADCEQALRDAEAAQKERLAAEARLNQARADLSAHNTALRALQKQLAETTEAAQLTRRQAEKLS